MTKLKPGDKILTNDGRTGTFIEYTWMGLNIKFKDASGKEQTAWTQNAKKVN